MRHFKIKHDMERLSVSNICFVETAQRYLSLRKCSKQTDDTGIAESIHYRAKSTGSTTSFEKMALLDLRGPQNAGM
jgi:hypothetical protein